MHITTVATPSIRPHDGGPVGYQYRTRLYCPACFAHVVIERAPYGAAVLPIPVKHRTVIVAARPCAACGVGLPLPPLFGLGVIAATPGALAACEAGLVNPPRLLTRHWTGDWGEIDPEDHGLNEDAIRDGARILSVYPLEGGATIWLITEAGRHATPLLLPSEY